MKFSANQFAIISAGVLMLITALGNAKILFVVSAFGLIIGFGYLRKNGEESSVLAVTIGFFLTLIIAVVFWLKK